MLAQAHGLTGIRVTKREEIPEAIARANAEPGTVVVEFRVEQEEAVYPMVPANADLRDMIRRPAMMEEDT
jgi:acetolactate synthase-1/2/3 large subunit